MEENLLSVENERHFTPMTFQRATKQDVLLEMLLIEAMFNVNGSESLLEFQMIGQFVDVMKVTQHKFWHKRGDLFTILEQIRDWVEHLKLGKVEDWAELHGFHLQVFREFEYHVKQRYESLKMECTPRKLTFNRGYETALQLILVDLFWRDLCVYTGHRNGGYVHVKSGQKVEVHDCSVLYVMETPNFILLPHCRKMCDNTNTSRNLSVALTTEEAEYILKKHHEYFSEITMEQLIPTKTTVGFCSPYILECMKRLWELNDGECSLRKRAQHIAENIPICVTFESSVVLYCRAQYIEPLESLITEELFKQGKYSQGIIERVRYPHSNGPMHIGLGSGCTLEYVNFDELVYVMLVQTSDVIFSQEEVIAMFTKYGSVEKTYRAPEWVRGHRRIWGTILYKSTRALKKLMVDTSPDLGFIPELTTTPLPWEDEQKLIEIDTSVKVEVRLCRRPRTGNARVTIRGIRDYAKVMRMRKINVDGSELDISVANEKSVLLFSGLNGIMKAGELKLAIVKQTGVNPASVVIELSPEQHPTKHELWSFKSMLDKTCEGIPPKEKHVYIDIPNASDSHISGALIFGSPKYAERGLRLLAGFKHNGQMLEITKAPKSWTIRVRLDHKLCDTLVPEFQNFEYSLSHNSRSKCCLTIHHTVNFEKRVKLVSSIVRPRFSLNLRTENENFLRRFPTLLTLIEKKTGTSLVVTLRFLRIYGNKTNAEMAKTMLKLDDNLPFLFRDTELSLEAIVKGFTSCDDFKNVDVYYDRVENQILLSATKNIDDIVVRLIRCSFLDKYILKLNEDDPHKPDCEIVFCETNLPSSGRYSLSACGHTYCLNCLQMHMKRVLPPLCIICDEPWSVVDIYHVVCFCFHEECLSWLIRIASYGSSYRHCPLPDCEGFGIVKEDRIHCQVCRTTYCIRCDTPAHEGRDCEISSTSHSLSVQQWLQENKESRKLCPHCGIGIEKNEGCLKVQCISCGHHICWLCLEDFDNYSHCYQHLKENHGSVFG